MAKIVERELESIDHKNQVTATPQFVASLVELVYNQLRTLFLYLIDVNKLLMLIVSLGEDLESFAK